MPLDYPYQATYLDAIQWQPHQTLEERVDLGPFQVAFAIGRGAHAVDAVEHARRELEIAQTVAYQVHEQAVFALFNDGFSTQAISQRTKIPRKTVRRIIRRFEGKHDSPQPIKTAPTNMGFDEAVRERIRTIWGHR